MFRIKISYLIALLLLSFCLNMVGYGQHSKTSNKIYLNVKKGGFKMLDGEGVVLIKGAGTLLLSHFKGKLQIPSSMRLEYDNGIRKVYFGSGLVQIRGGFRAIQWCGKNLKASWQGKGSLKLLTEENMGAGEGFYRFEGSMKKFPWKSMNHFSIRLPIQLENTKTK